MTGKERREQLLDIGRRLFAERGLDGTSIEEIAAQADVSKPVVYEHFGGKEGLYAVVVDREVERFLTMATRLLEGEDTMAKFEVAAVELLRYIQDNSDGFRILVRDSNPTSGSGTFASLISDIASQVEYILGDVLEDRGYDPKLAPMYAQMLVGMVAFTGQWWLDARKPKLEEMAAHLVNLAWNGLSELDPKPRISPEAMERLRRGAVAPAGGPRYRPDRDHEDPPEREHRAVRRRRVGLADPRPVLGQELVGLPGRQRREHRPQAGALVPLDHRIVAVQHVQVGRLPRVDLEARPGQQVQVLRRVRGLPVELDAGQQRAPAAEPASSRSDRVARLVEVAGHLERQPAAVGQETRPARQHVQVIRHPLQHRVGDDHVHPAVRLPVPDVAEREAEPPAVGRQRPRAPRSSRPSSRSRGPARPATGRPASAVSVPGPQPRSTTTAGASAATRPTRSKNGRDRSSAKRRYCAGSHTASRRR